MNIMMETKDGKTLEFVGTFKPVEEMPEIEEDNTVKMIAGKLNNTKCVYYWTVDKDFDYEIGDYAIVENMNDYDLVKIIGTVETNDKYLKLLTNVNVNKKVIEIVDRSDIRED